VTGLTVTATVTTNVFMNALLFACGDSKLGLGDDRLIEPKQPGPAFRHPNGGGHGRRTASLDLGPEAGGHLVEALQLQLAQVCCALDAAVSLQQNQFLRFQAPTARASTRGAGRDRSTLLTTTRLFIAFRNGAA